MLGAKTLMACLVAGVVAFGPVASASAAEGKGHKHHKHHKKHHHKQHHKKN
jgi:hypothetical protein